MLATSALVSGAAHWLQPREAEVISYWYVAGADAALVAIIAWNVAELGFFEAIEP